MIQHMFYDMFLFFVMSFCFVIPFVHQFAVFQEEEVRQSGPVRLACVGLLVLWVIARRLMGYHI